MQELVIYYPGVLNTRVVSNIDHANSPEHTALGANIAADPVNNTDLTQTMSTNAESREESLIGSAISNMNSRT